MLTICRITNIVCCTIGALAVIAGLEHFPPVIAGGLLAGFIWVIVMMGVSK